MDKVGLLKPTHKIQHNSYTKSLYSKLLTKY